MVGLEHTVATMETDHCWLKVMTSDGVIVDFVIPLGWVCSVVF